MVATSRTSDLPVTTSAVGRVRYSRINAISGSVRVMEVVVAAVSLMSMTSHIELIKAHVLNRLADAAEPFVLVMVDHGTGAEGVRVGDVWHAAATAAPDGLAPSELKVRSYTTPPTPLQPPTGLSRRS